MLYRFEVIPLQVTRLPAYARIEVFVVNMPDAVEVLFHPFEGAAATEGVVARVEAQADQFGIG
jgi:hypothetical protein